MRATFVLSGDEGGKYTVQIEMSALPRPGDHILLSGPHPSGTEEFVVRQTSWHLHQPETPGEPEKAGEMVEITIECEKHKTWAPDWIL